MPKNIYFRSKGDVFHLRSPQYANTFHKQIMEIKTTIFMNNLYNLFQEMLPEFQNYQQTQRIPKTA